MFRQLVFLTSASLALFAAACLAHAQRLSVQNVIEITPKEIMNAKVTQAIYAQMNHLKKDYQTQLTFVEDLQDEYRSTRNSADLETLKKAVKHLKSLKAEYGKRKAFLNKPIKVQLIDDPYGRHKLPRLKTHQSIMEFLTANWGQVVRKDHFIMALPLHHSASGLPTKRGATRVSPTKTAATPTKTPKKAKPASAKSGASWLGVAGAKGKSGSKPGAAGAAGSKTPVGALSGKDFFGGGSTPDKTATPGKPGALGF